MLAPEDYVTEEERLRAEREAAFRAEAEQVSQPRCSAHICTCALCACARAAPASAPAPACMRKQEPTSKSGASLNTTDGAAAARTLSVAIVLHLRQARCSRPASTACIPPHPSVHVCMHAGCQGC
jgi:hypothetical protein